MAGYRVLPAADQDLDDLADDYEGQASLELALRFYDAAHETCALLATQPDMGRERKLRDPRLAGARWVLVKHFEEHLVFYRSTENGVEILRVLHGKQDLREILGD